MRLHRNLCFAIIDGVLQVFNEGAYADKVIQTLLKRVINAGEVVTVVLWLKQLMILYAGNDFMQKLQKLKHLLVAMMHGDFLQFGRR